MLDDIDGLDLNDRIQKTRMPALDPQQADDFYMVNARFRYGAEVASRI
jgi:hypothetical protein